MAKQNLSIMGSEEVLVKHFISRIMKGYEFEQNYARCSLKYIFNYNLTDGVDE